MGFLIVFAAAVAWNRSSDNDNRCLNHNGNFPKEPHWVFMCDIITTAHILVKIYEDGPVNKGYSRRLGLY